MAEVLGLAASAIQVADTGFQLYGALSQYVRRYDGATIDAIRLADEIRITSLTLQQLGTLLQRNDKMQSCRPEVIQRTGNVLDCCRTTFDEVQYALGDIIREPAEADLIKLIGWRWPFEKNRALLLIAQLERSMTTLLLMFMVLSSASELAPGKDASKDALLPDEKIQIMYLNKAKKLASEKERGLQAELDTRSILEESNLSDQDTSDTVEVEEGTVHTTTTLGTDKTNSGVYRAPATARTRPPSCRVGDQRDHSRDMLKPESSTDSGKCGQYRQKDHANPLKCKRCRKRFNHVYNLRSHLRIHCGRKPFTCEVCGMRFTRPYDLNRHEGVHFSRSRFLCRGNLHDDQRWGCGLRFDRPGALRRHFQSDIGRTCIRPLWIEEQQQAQAAAHEAELGRHFQELKIESNIMLPTALLLQYPELSGIDPKNTPTRKTPAKESERDQEQNFSIKRPKPKARAASSAVDTHSGLSLGPVDELVRRWTTAVV